LVIFGHFWSFLGIWGVQNPYKVHENAFFAIFVRGFNTALFWFLESWVIFGLFRGFLGFVWNRSGFLKSKGVKKGVFLGVFFGRVKKGSFLVIFGGFWVLFGGCFWGVKMGVFLGGKK
jgi:hypothetical protein